MDVDNENMVYFWRWIYERQMIYHKRFELSKMPPWTQDPILANHHFCNVYRELDKGTKYIIDILGKVHGPADALWNILVYRYFNSIPTFDFLLDGSQFLPFSVNWDHKQIAVALRRWEQADAGHQVFTGAFTVTGVRFGGYSDKISNVCYLMEQIQHKIPVILFDLTHAPDFRAAYHTMLNIDGYGRFLAFQVAVDWAYYDTRLDRNSFAEPGPGCRNGLRWLYPHLRGTNAFHEAIKYLTDSQEYYFAKYNLDFPYYEGKWIVASDIENCLCEFSKYMRMRTGQRPDGSVVRAGGRSRIFNAQSRIQAALI